MIDGRCGSGAGIVGSCTGAAVVATVVLGLVGYRGSWPDRSFASLRLLVGAYDADLSPDPTPIREQCRIALGLTLRRRR